MSRRTRPKPSITDVIRALQKLEAITKSTAFAMIEDAENIDFSDAVALIAEKLSAALLTLDQVEVSIGKEVSDGRK